ncbi:hypothetical protein JCM15519_01890 [Fundidesulfovibrio butyratiphilus]
MYVDTTSYLNSIKSSTTSDTASSSLSSDDFITLLVAQLETQDPTNPVDEKEMVSQLTQFSMLEQLTDMNETLTSGLSLLNYQSAASAVNYIGKSVMATGYSLSVDDGSVSSATYTLDSDTPDLKAYVYDSDGSLVNTIDLGAKKSGDYTFKWDGTDSDGNAVADGTYSLALVSTDSSGNESTVSTQVSGLVTGMSVEDSAIKLTLEDGREVNLADVQTVTAS